MEKLRISNYHDETLKTLKKARNAAETYETFITGSWFSFVNKGYVSG